MKKTFQKSLLVAAMGAAALASTAVNAGSYGTTNVFFPYITTAFSAFTFITLAGVGAGGAAHYRYAMKSTTAANSTGCEHQDGNGTLTANDVLQFEVSNKLNVATGIGSGDVTGTSYPFTGGANKHGYLIVNTAVPGGSLQNLYGEAVIVDTATGLRMAYTTGGLNTDGAANPDFSINNTGVAGGPEAAPTFVPSGFVAPKGTNVVTWYRDGAAFVTTSWFVVPLGATLEMTPAGAVGGLIAGYNMGDSAGAAGQNGAYDVNEAFHSGSIRTDVRCIGVITRANMLQPGALANTTTGGTAHLSTYNQLVAGDGAPAGGTAATPSKSLVYKMQSSPLVGGGSTFISRESIR